MRPQYSELALEIRLPNFANDSIDFQTASGMAWSHSPGEIPENLRAEVLWSDIVHDWPNRRNLLYKAGAALGSWLFDQRAQDFLHEQVSGWSQGQPRRRVELRVSSHLTEWPWEMITVEGLEPLAAHAALTLVRVSDEGEQPQLQADSQLSIEIIGVKLDEGVGWVHLDTGRETERIRLEIEAAGSQGRFAVKVDPLGEWEALVRRYRALGPPHVFHFAGHGLDNGRGLVFRSAAGGPEEIPADLIASMLSRRTQGRQTRLAVLNACSTAAAGRGPFQPFGGLARMLIKHHVPMVVGFETPVEDHFAQQFATSLYGSIARGDTVDCALQDARESLYYLSGLAIAWAFASLTISGTPQSLWRPFDGAAARQPSADILDFGHDDQRHRLERFLKRQHPLVVVIHGELRSGHRHVAHRVQQDLERAGNVLWRPVSTMYWFVAGEPLLSRSQLAGGIARALTISDTGTQNELEERIAGAIAERCADNKVVVINLEEILSLRDETQADALVSLVRDLWSDLMATASQRQSRLPVFLILSVAYPKLLPAKHPSARIARRQALLTAKTIELIAEKSRLKGGVRVEVLPKLEPIDVNYVANFLEEVLDLDRGRAESIASDLVGLEDNESILERVNRLLSEWSLP